MCSYIGTEEHILDRILLVAHETQSNLKTLQKLGLCSFIWIPKLNNVIKQKQNKIDKYR